MVVFSIFFFFECLAFNVIPPSLNIYIAKRKGKLLIVSVCFKKTIIKLLILIAHCFIQSELAVSIRIEPGPAYTAVMQLCLCMQGDIYTGFTDHNIQ